MATMLHLPDGARAYIEGVPCFDYILASSDEQFDSRLRDLRRQWPELSKTPPAHCRRAVGLVEKDGCVSWRMSLILDLPHASAFMGVSEPISAADIQNEHGMIWLAHHKLPADFAPGVEEAWRAGVNVWRGRMAPSCYEE